MTLANVHAVLEDLLRAKDSITATDLAQLKFSIVAYKMGTREIRKDFEIQLKELEMDKFDRLERVVKKLATKSHEDASLEGYHKLTFEPDKTLNSFNNIVQDGDGFSSKANGAWTSLWSAATIPNSGKHYCEVELVRWGHGNCNLMFGLCSSTLKPQQSSYGQADSVSLYLQNNNSCSLYERGGNFRPGSFGYFEEGDRILMKINMDNGVVTWCFGGETIMMTRIGRDLRAKQLHIKAEYLYTTEKIRFV